MIELICCKALSSVIFYEQQRSGGGVPEVPLADQGTNFKLLFPKWKARAGCFEHCWKGPCVLLRSKQGCEMYS